MNEEQDRSRIIKPPLERIASGKMFHPNTRFIFKGLVSFGLFFLLVWTLGSLFWIGLSYAILVLDRGALFSVWLDYVWYWWPMAAIYYWAVALTIYAIGMVVFYVYVRRIGYSVRSERGDAMPEIFVKKGLANITEKHVPFRTITNIASRAGPLDRIFGIGNIEIHTAGFSGGPQTGSKPEEKLEGILFYKELRDFILQELRRFTKSYVTTTEVTAPDDVFERNPMTDSDEELIFTLRQIREVLEKLDRKLDQEE
jgi:membrane protein YdbS with pleckstrin-like domain